MKCSTGKVQHQDRPSAKRVAKKSTKQGRRLSFYLCGECNTWHTTKWKGRAEIEYTPPKRRCR